MYIKNFHIEEFGPLKDFSVNNIPCGMAVFLGNNEAGKSSAMEFVRAMLMGIPTKRNPLTQNIRNSKGGSMKIHDTTHGEIDLVRNFSTSASLVQLYDVHGNVCKDTILTEMMGGISRDVYRMIYGFNLLELQNINTFHGSEIFNTILGASFGLGLRGPVAALENIQERMDSIYKTRGKNTILQKLFDTWNNNKEALDIAFEEIKQFDSLQKEREKLDLSLSTLRDEKSDIILKNDELQSLIGMWGQWEKWFELQNTIASLPPLVVSFPDNAELVLERILEQKKIKQQNLDSLQIRQNALNSKQNDDQTDELLLAHQAALKDLMEEKGSYRQALTETTALAVKAEQFSHVLEDINSRLKDKWQMLDGHNKERHALMGVDMALYLATTPHDYTFIDEFSQHEAKILEAERHTQNAITALEYAQKDTRLAKEKIGKIEKDIQSILQEEASSQSESVLSHMEKHDNVADKIILAKDAIRLLPAVLDRSHIVFDDWKKQAGHIEIRALENELANSFDEENSTLDTTTVSSAHASDAHASIAYASTGETEIPFTIINNAKDRNYYKHASTIMQLILEKSEKILPIAQKFIVEEESSRVLAEKIEYLDSLKIEPSFISQNIDGDSSSFHSSGGVSGDTSITDDNFGDISDIPDDTDGTFDDIPDAALLEFSHAAPSKVLGNAPDLALENENIAIPDENNLKVKNRALKKLQIINTLRTQSIQQLEDLLVKQNMLIASIEDKKISSFAILPGLFCLGLGLPLLVLRLLSKQNIITLDAIQNIISFATYFPLWNGSIYVPLWLPLVLTGIAVISIYLPASRKAAAREELRKLDDLDDEAEGIRESLISLRKAEALILSHIFHMDNEKQALFHEKAKASVITAPPLGFAKDLNVALSDSIASNENIFDAHKAQKQNNVSNENSLPNQNNLANENNSEIDKNNIPNEATLPIEAETHEGRAAVNDVSLTLSLGENAHKDADEAEHRSDEDPIFQQTQGIDYIIEINTIHRDSLKEILQYLEKFLQRAPEPISSEEQADELKVQIEEKRAKLINEKQRCKALFDESRALLYNYRLEWEKFFQQYFFNQIPEPKDMEAFFLRLEACVNTQKRLTELNMEAYTYNQHIADFQAISQNEFPEVCKQLEPLLTVDKINPQTLIDAVEKHIQEQRLSLLRGRDTVAQEASLEAAIQTENEAKAHMKNVEENLQERQKNVDNYYEECVLFLCKNKILSSQNAAEYYQKMLGEVSKLYPTNTTEEAIKRISLPLVRQLVELMERFDNTMLEYEKINSDVSATYDITADFETFLQDLMEEAEFTPIFNENSKIDYLKSFEQFHAKTELEVAKTTDKANIELQHGLIKDEIFAIQADLHEINNNMEILLTLAKVQNESQLREFIEAQKQRNQIIKNSLALEEPFRSVNLPKYTEKSLNPGKRKYAEDPAWNIEKLPEIFDYFDEMAKQVWQEKLRQTKKSHDILEGHEHEIQNNYGVLQEKCDALIHSATLAHLRREQLEIEEKIEEAYERWLELSFTKQVITKARKQYEQDKQPRVIEIASDFFATITDNAWEKIVVSIDDKNIKVVGKNGAPVNPEVLSQGTKEQLYLSLRLAHIQNRAQDHQYLPILMDDILVNFDKNRMEKTIDTINKLIVSHHETPMQNSEQYNFEKQSQQNYSENNGTERIRKNTTTEKETQGQQILFYTCHEDTAQMLQDKITETKIYLVENKTVRPA